MKTKPPSNAEAQADAVKMIILKDYTLAMGIIFDMTSDLSRKMVRRMTIPSVALKELRNKYLEGKSDDDFVELMDMWESMKPIPKETDHNGLLDLMLELNERMEDLHKGLKCEPIEFYAKYKRLLQRDYDPCITTFKLAFTPSIYRPINQTEFDELGRANQAYWKALF